MSDKKSYFKREPKNRGHFKGLGSVFPACCGMTCCGHHGKVARKEIRTFRNQEKRSAILEGIKDTGEE